MSVLTTALIVIAGILAFVWIIAIYITNVTAREGDIPRWVMGLGLLSLLVAFAALLTVL